MGLENFEIELMNSSGIFYAGQPVQGQVVIHLSDDKNMSAVKIKLRGKGYVHFTTTRQRTRRDSNGNTHTETETIHHRSGEEYVDQEQVLFHGPSLGPGKHVFPFNLFLAPLLPSSFEGAYGHVRYYLEGVIVRDWLWNHRTKHHITVNSILDLNQYPALVHPTQNRNHKNFCCLCCKSGPLSVVISTDKQGYVSGEYLVFSAEVDNKSNKEMDYSEVRLLEKIKFKAGGEHKDETREVASMRREGIEPGDSDLWDRVHIQVPPLPPSYLGQGRPCGIIDLIYVLEFRVNPSGIGFSLYTEIPITIGTIPLRSIFNQIQPTSDMGAWKLPGPVPGLMPPTPTSAGHGSGSGSSSSSSSSHGSPKADAPPSYEDAGAYPPAPGMYPPLPDTFTGYQDLPPPSYNQSFWGQSNIRGDDDDENTAGNFNFAPQYPTYNFIQPSAPPMLHFSAQ